MKVLILKVGSNGARGGQIHN